MISDLSQTTLPISAALLQVGTQISRQRLDIEEVGDYIPGSVMKQNLSLMTNTYMNKQGCDILRHSKEELQFLGSRFFETFFPADEAVYLTKELRKFILAGDYTSAYSFFQRVRPDSESNYKWYFTTSRLAPPDEAGGFPNIIHIALDINSLGLVGKKICRLCEDSYFMTSNYLKFTRLSKREKEIIALIASGTSSYEISDKLFISIHTVNNHRKHILSKLEIHTVAELIRFAEAFDLI